MVLYVYVWSAVDVGSRVLLDLEETYFRSCLKALTSLRKALETPTNRPLVIVET